MHYGGEFRRQIVRLLSFEAHSYPTVRWFTFLSREVRECAKVLFPTVGKGDQCFRVQKVSKFQLFLRLDNQNRDLFMFSSLQLASQSRRLFWAFVTPFSSFQGSTRKKLAEVPRAWKTSALSRRLFGAVSWIKMAAFMRIKRLR